MDYRYLKDTLNEFILFYDQDFMKVSDVTTINIILVRQSVNALQPAARLANSSFTSQAQCGVS
jgi:hypothetical protein